jgi:hypothetical protein
VDVVEQGHEASGEGGEVPPGRVGVRIGAVVDDLLAEVDVAQAGGHEELVVAVAEVVDHLRHPIDPGERGQDAAAVAQGRPAVDVVGVLPDVGPCLLDDHRAPRRGVDGAVDVAVGGAHHT